MRQVPCLKESGVANQLSAAQKPAIQFLGYLRGLQRIKFFNSHKCSGFLLEDAQIFLKKMFKNC